MNGHAARTHGPLRRLGNAVDVLVHADTAKNRYLSVFFAAALGGGAVLVLWLGEDPRMRDLGLLLAAAAVALVSAVWFSRLLLLQVEARQSRLPGLEAELAGAGALAFVLGVVAPTLVLAVLGVPQGRAICVLSSAACAGVLLMLLPRIWYLVLCLVPVLLMFLATLLELVLPEGAGLGAWRPSFADAVWMLPVLLAVTGWRWHRIVTRGVDHVSPWWQPGVLSGAKPGADWGWYSGGKLTAQMPDVFWPAGKTDGAGPADPVRSMRALLGTPFAPLSRAQLAVQGGLMALVCGYVAAAALLDGGDPSMLAGAGIGGAAVMVVMFGQRLEALYSRRSTELDELALLPGLGAAAMQRRSLLRAVLLPPAVVAVVLLVLLAGVTMLAGLSAAVAGLLALSATGVILVTVLACLRPIAGLPMNGWRLLLVAGPVALLALVGTVYATAVRTEPGAGLLLTAGAWITAFAILGTMTASTLRRFRRRPHPFLSY